MRIGSRRDRSRASGRSAGHNRGSLSTLVITADDYGYSPRYDEGIVEVARAGAVDSVSAMVLRGPPAAGLLLATGVEVGLHLELGSNEARARDEAALQLERFQRLFDRDPAYLDGHRHCHTQAAIASMVAELARGLGLPVRSVDSRHRRLLRRLGVATPDLLIGRLEEDEPALPAELAGGGSGLPDGVIEWMVHPGRRDPESGSRYDRGREEDLELLLGWQAPPGLRRSTHQAALIGD
jgi:predicted glycoside hydrolase/deacetylase ChbG (UPF0249 family)